MGEIAAHFDRPESAIPLLKDMLQYAFTENVGGENILRTNAIAFHLRALQLAGEIPSEPKALEKFLTECQIGIVDVGNLKRINEDQAIGGSTAAGDRAIAIHARSIAAATDGHGMVATFRQQGDEFLVLVHPDQPTSQSEMKHHIEKATTQIIQGLATDPGDPLHKIATEHPELLTKTMSWTSLDRVGLPSNICRTDDIAEYLMNAAETAANKSPASSSAKAILRRLDLPRIFDMPPQKDKNAVELIMRAIAQTTTITDREKKPDILQERWTLIDRYLPPSLHETVNSLKQLAKGPEGASLLALLTEETIFNLQFGRNPPILTPWAFRELTQVSKTTTGEYTYDKVGMVSTFFIKVANTLAQRLAGTAILRHLCRTVTRLIPTETSDEQPTMIVCKEGGSLYYSATTDSEKVLSEGLAARFTRLFKALEKLSQSETNRRDKLQPLLVGATLMPIFAPAQSIPKGDRTAEFMGKLYDRVRQNQYLHESRLARALANAMIDFPEMYTVLSAFMLERSARRVQDMTSLEESDRWEAKRLNRQALSQR